MDETTKQDVLKAYEERYRALLSPDCRLRSEMNAYNHQLRGMADIMEIIGITAEEIDALESAIDLEFDDDL